MLYQLHIDQITELPYYPSLIFYGILPILQMKIFIFKKFKQEATF